MKHYLFVGGVLVPLLNITPTFAACDFNLDPAVADNKTYTITESDDCRVTTPQEGFLLGSGGSLVNSGRIEADVELHAPILGFSLQSDPTAKSLVNNEDAYIISSTGTAVFLFNGIESITNHGDITTSGGTNSSIAVDLQEAVGRVFNSETGTIYSENGLAFSAASTVKEFINNGTISGDTAAFFSGTVGRFENNGQIGASGLDAVTFDSDISGEFYNGAGGGIVSDKGSAVYQSEGSIASFRNDGSLKSFGTPEPFVIAAVDLHKVDSFVNNGTIEGSETGALSVVEAGTIFNGLNGDMSGRGTDEMPAGAVTILTKADELRNEGLIRLEGTGAAIVVGEGLTRLINKGIVLSDSTGVLSFATSDSRIQNSGNIISRDTTENFTSAAIAGHNFSIDNSGSIEGYYGIAIDGSTEGKVSITNSGRIAGSSGTAIDLDYFEDGLARNDVLKIKPGSVIDGSVKFGAGQDTLDLSAISGPFYMQVVGLETVVKGSNLVVQTPSEVMIVDPESAKQGGGGFSALMLNLNQQISSIVGGTLTLAAQDGASLASDSPALSYAGLAAGGAESAAFTGLRSSSAAARAFWLMPFGGGSREVGGGGETGLYGGLIGGVSFPLSETLRVSAYGGYTRSAISDTASALDTDLALLGVRLRAEAGRVTLDFGLTGGFGRNTTSRNTGAGTADGSYNSFFVAPEAAASMPVYKDSLQSLAVQGAVRAVLGKAEGYTEAGAPGALTFADQFIALGEASLSLQGERIVGSTEAGNVRVFGSLGGFAQKNFGDSSLSAQALGQALSFDLPDDVQFGVAGGLGVSVPFSGGTLTAAVDGRWRNDNRVSGTARLEARFNF